MRWPSRSLPVIGAPSLGPRPLGRSRIGSIFPDCAEQGVGHIAKELGISRKTVESHSEHIKLKLGYANAEELKRGARELIGTA